MINILLLLAQAVFFCNCYEITQLGDHKSLIAESPFWDAEKNSIVYTDVSAQYVGKPHILRHDLATNVTKGAVIEGITDENTKLGFILPVEGSKDLYVVGIANNFEVVQWDGESPTAKVVCTQFELEPVKTNFIHSGHVDPQGNFYYETVRFDMCNPNVTLPSGSSYRSKDGKTFEKAIGGLNIANDFTFDEEKNIIYYVDSCNAQIRAQDVDPETGALSNERVVFDNKENPEEKPLKGPDGIVLDTDGNIWATGNGEKTVYQINPNTGERLQTIPFPAQFVQSLTWGGPNLDILYIGTASVVYSIQTGQIHQMKLPEEEGHLYQITGLGARGRKVAPKIHPRYASCVAENGPSVGSAEPLRLGPDPAAAQATQSAQVAPAAPTAQPAPQAAPAAPAAPQHEHLGFRAKVKKVASKAASKVKGFFKHNCYKITQLGNAKSLIAESPFYDAEKNSIIYTDVSAQYVGKPHILRHDLKTNVTKGAVIENIKNHETKLGFILPVEGSKDLHVVGIANDFDVVQWDGESKTAKVVCTQFELEPVKTNFIHSGHVDPQGIFYYETVRFDMCNPNVTLPSGSIFRSKDGKTFEKAIGGLNIANDFTFDEQKNIIYYVDSCYAQIRAKDYNPKTGALSNERVIYDNRDSPKEKPLKGPDGIVLDTDGNIWATGNGEKTVYQINPKTGKRLQTIPFPAQFVQSLTWGGPNLDILYVGTASVVYSIQTGKIFQVELPEAEGHLYQITGLGARGRKIAPKIHPRYASCVNSKTKTVGKNK